MSFTLVIDSHGALNVRAICANAHEINQLIEKLLEKRDKEFVQPQMKEPIHE